MLDLKKDFPYFDEEKTIYFDNSSTTLKPKIVLENAKLNNIYSFNARRGINKNIVSLNKKVEKTREKVARFINAKSFEEIAFTSGATESSNLFAYSYCLNNLKNNDEILVCNKDHKSTVLPILNVKNYLKDINVKNIEIDYEGDYNEEDLFSKVTNKTKVLVLTHIHNIYGLEMNIEQIVTTVRKINKDIIIVLDISQSIGHIEIDIQKLGVDVAYFSGHKMLGLQGVGVIYIKKQLLNSFSPFIIGGSYDEKEITNITNIRQLECGTKNYTSILSLEDSIDYINYIGIKNIEEHIYMLTRYLYDGLKKINKIKFNKGINNCKCALGYGIISFNIEGVAASEVSQILEDYNILVRTGDFCNTTNNENYIRVSLYVYNTTTDIDKFLEVINYLINQL